MVIYNGEPRSLALKKKHPRTRNLFFIEFIRFSGIAETGQRAQLRYNSDTLDATFLVDPNVLATFLQNMNSTKKRN
jgi:hypothetical protein